MNSGLCALGTLTVTAYALLATADNLAKVYGAAVPALTGTLVGVHNGDAITATFITTATQASNAGGYAITPVLADPNNLLTNYTVTLVNGTLTVTPAPLTITAANKTKVYGTANPTLTATITGFVNGDTAASLDTPVALATTADNASPAGSYPITAGNTADANYTITHVSGTLTVTPAPLTITAENKTKVYGTANPPLTASYAGFVNGDTAASLDTPVALATTADNASPAGSYPITAGNTADANYTITHVSGTLTVTPAPLTITAENKTKVYGTANPPLTASYAGFVNGDTSASLDTAVTLATAADNTSPVGSYPITASGAADANYSIAYVSGSLSVTPAPLTITADNKTKVYGAALPALTGTLVGVQNGDAITASFITAATQASAAGNHAITPALADPDNKLGNYAVTLVNGTLSITPAPLTITADDKAKTQGAANPLLTAGFVGFVNGDDADDLNTPVSLSTAANVSSPSGSYPITAGGAADLNYTITFVPGTLTITGVA